MSAIAFKFRCGNCILQFEAPGLSDFSYGEFVMRTNGGHEMAFLNALSDEVFSELRDIVKRHPLLTELDERAVGTVVQMVFTATCDRSPDGEAFEIGLLPRCPHCGSRKMGNWEIVVPVREWPLPDVSHDLWRTKPMEEKILGVDDAIRRFFRT